ncbi:MAG TPA: hypothetical protein VFJ19_19435 [Nocardioidaceae bacterium]|nr:hypothetical protein [Nocardioidaceae bacterium]
MATNPHEKVRVRLVRQLLRRIDEDPYPSVTMMDMVEGLLTSDEDEEYARILMSKVDDEQYPSVSILGRLRALATA